MTWTAGSLRALVRSHSSAVFSHLQRVHSAVGAVFPQTERTHKPMQRVGTLSEVRRRNAQRAAESRMAVLYLGIDPPEASYEVVAPEGFQFSKLVGVVVPRTERELQRQAAYLTGRFSNDRGDDDGAADAGAFSVSIVDRSQTQPQQYTMPAEMVDQIREIRSGVIGKSLPYLFPRQDT